MASYASSASVEFSPFIPSVDPGLYASVLMQKKQQYDIGLQKVQSATDSVYGLEVTREQDKQYLTQKIGEMQSQLDTLATADFSQNDVIRRATMTANQVARDPRIQNAVLSTQKLKKLSASQAEKEAKGDYFPEAKYYDNLKVQEYLTSDKDYIYDGPVVASTYRDFNEPLTKVLKEVDPTITTKILPNGKLSYFVEETSTITPQQIESITKNFFETNPQYRESMQMSALYNYQNIQSKETLAQSYADYYNKVSTGLEDQIAKLNEDSRLHYNDLQRVQQNDSKLINLRNLLQTYVTESDATISRILDPNVALSSNKVEAFLSTIVKGAVMRFEESNSKWDEKESAFGKRAASFINAGLDPETGLPPTINSPYYTTIKRSNGSSADSGEGITSMVGAPTKMETQTMSVLENKVKTLSAQNIPKLQSLQKMYKNAVPTATTADFADYITTQENKLLLGEKVDENYLLYRQQTQPSRVLAGSLQEATDQIKQEAAERYGIDSIEPYTVKVGNSTVTLSPGNEEDVAFLTELSRFRDDYKKMYDSLSEFNQEFARNIARNHVPLANNIIPIGAGAMARKPTKKQLAVWAPEEFSKRFASYLPEEQLAAITSELADGTAIRPTVTIDEILKPVNNKLKERTRFEDKEADKLQQRTTFPTLILEGDTKFMDTYKRLIKSSVSAQHAENPNSSEIPRLEDIKPISTYLNLDGKYVIRYEEGKSRQIKEVEAVTKSELIPGADQGFWLKSAVDLTGTTPRGENALATRNGTLRYVIYKNDLDNTYDVALLDGSDKTLPISSRNKVSDPNNPYSGKINWLHPKYIQERLEFYSQQINPQTGKPFTRQELISFLTTD